MGRVAIRAYLLVFIAGILGWIITSSSGFYAGAHQDMPQWMMNWPPFSRLLFFYLTTNIYYTLIALGLFIEFVRPKIEFRWSGRRALSALGVILIANALIVGWNNGLFFGDLTRLIDTVIYGLGFGTLFLLHVPERTLGLSIVLWTRLIEVGGFFLGYFFTPALLSMWPEGYTLGHFVHGPAFMFTNYFFWTDYVTAVGSLIGVIVLLRVFKFSRFWIASFLVGAVVVGYNIARYIITHF